MSARIDGSNGYGVNCGGIHFNKGDVSSVKKTKDGFNEVTLRTGQILRYPDQKSPKNPYVLPMVMTSKNKDGSVSLHGLDLSRVTIMCNPNTKEQFLITGDHNTILPNKEDTVSTAGTVVLDKGFPVVKDTNKVITGNNS